LADQDIEAFRPEGNDDRVGKFVNANENKLGDV
jgi:hypothetical protein